MAISMVIGFFLQKYNLSMKNSCVLFVTKRPRRLWFFYYIKMHNVNIWNESDQSTSTSVPVFDYFIISKCTMLTYETRATSPPQLQCTQTSVHQNISDSKNNALNQCLVSKTKSLKTDHSPPQSPLPYHTPPPIFADVPPSVLKNVPTHYLVFHPFHNKGLTMKIGREHKTLFIDGCM